VQAVEIPYEILNPLPRVTAAVTALFTALDARVSKAVGGLMSMISTSSPSSARPARRPRACSPGTANMSARPLSPPGAQSRNGFGTG